MLKPSSGFLQRKFQRYDQARVTPPCRHSAAFNPASHSRPSRRLMSMTYMTLFGSYTTICCSTHQKLRQQVAKFENSSSAIQMIHFAKTDAAWRVQSQFAYLELPSIANWLLISTWLTLYSRAITTYAVCVIFVLWSTKTLLPSWPAWLSLLDSTTVMQCYMEPRAKCRPFTARVVCNAPYRSCLNRFVKCGIGCRSNNEFSTRLLCWLTRFDFINNHSVYVNSSTTTCLLNFCGLQTMLYY